jgi:integrase
MHKWIGTYNLFRIYLLRFFKWIYYPDIEPGKRPRPSAVENIAQLKRKEKSIYKPSDLWTQQDDLLFLKYCPSKRDKCYHAMSRDLSCRPHEILKLKIRDIAFKTTGTYQYAEVVVNGKTGTRPIPLINSIPYLKDYLDHEHSQPTNPNSPLICGTGKGLGRHIRPARIYNIYRKYKEQIFPKLLESPSVLPEDKQKITELLKKPWNPYIRRHSALTEKSTILKEHILRQHRRGLKCYHMVSRDLSCRPHELLKLKVKDVFFKSTGGYQYAEVLLNGKTGTRPFLREFIQFNIMSVSNPCTRFIIVGYPYHSELWSILFFCSFSLNVKQIGFF